MTERIFAKFDDQGRLIVNTERWQSIADESGKWRGRYRALASHIVARSSVIEFGCGSMALRDMLPPGCTYQASDIVSRCADCLVLDLTQPLPPRLAASYDAAVFAGVLEYVPDLPGVVAWAAVQASAVLFSYATTDDFSDLDRRRNVYGWFSHLAHSELMAMSATSGLGLEIQHIGRWNSQNLYRAARV